VRRTLRVPAAEAGRRLVDVVSERFRADGVALLEAGAVFVDRRRASVRDGEARLRGNELLEVEDAPDAPLSDLEVLHEDEDVAFVFKPSGISSTGDLRGDAATLLAACRARFGAAHLAGRLDRSASGVVLVLRSRRARATVPVLRRAGAVVRSYVVLSDARPEAAHGRSTTPIGADPSRRGRMRLDGPGARAAETSWEATPVGPGAEIRARPRTGRTHQVRIHLAEAGAPVLGDGLYGGAMRLALDGGRVLAVSRLALHCESVALPHPVRGVPLRAHRAPPSDYEALKTALRSAAPGTAPRASSRSRG
jgi:23S rRNA pseudouridine1911/1915/1917 synthase